MDWLIVFEMNPNVKILLAAGSVFVALVAANMVAESLYTNSKIGTDKKVLIIGTVAGIAAVWGVTKIMKVKPA